MSSLPREKVSEASKRIVDSSSQKNSGIRTVASRKRWLTLFAVTATEYRGESAPAARPNPVMEWIIEMAVRRSPLAVRAARQSRPTANGHRPAFYRSSKYLSASFASSFSARSTLSRAASTSSPRETEIGSPYRNTARENGSGTTMRSQSPSTFFFRAEGDGHDRQSGRLCRVNDALLGDAPRPFRSVGSEDDVEAVARGADHLAQRSGRASSGRAARDVHAVMRKRAGDQLAVATLRNENANRPAIRRVQH